MQAVEFINKVEACAPSTEQLRAIGMCDEDIEKFRESFLAPLRKEPASFIAELGEVGRLFQYYNLEKLLVGILYFDEWPTENFRNWKIGKIETDLLIVDKFSKEVRVLDFSKNDNILWFVSENCDSMLSALAVAECFLSKRAVDEALWEDISKAEVVVNECVSLAGGEKYRSFYSMLLGI